MLTAPTGAVAQLVERLLCKEKVRSSNLLGSTERPRDSRSTDLRVSFEVRRRASQGVAMRRPDRVQPASDDRAFEPVHVFAVPELE
jgi:hypothetical protein